MIKSWMRLCSLALCVPLLTLASCGDSKDNNTNQPTGEVTGRYIEEDITPSMEDRGFQFMTTNDKLICVDTALKTQYESTDNGKNWIKTDGLATKNPSIQEALNAEDGYLPSISLPDGRFVFFQSGKGLFLVGLNGGITPIPLKEVDDAIKKNMEVYVYPIHATKQGLLLLEYNISPKYEPEEGGDGMTPLDGEFLTSEVGEGVSKTIMLSVDSATQLFELSGDDAYPTAVASDENFLYIQGYENTIEVYNLSDGKKASRGTIALPQDGDGNSYYSSAGLSVENDGNILCLNQGDLIRITPDNSVETIMDGETYSFGNAYANSISLRDDESIVMMMSAYGTDKLYRYVFDPKADSTIHDTVTVWSLNENYFINVAVVEFRKKNPNIAVEYKPARQPVFVTETGETGGSATEQNVITIADAIKNLNVEILSGGGPDVLILDGCPVEAYVEQGLLLDLKDSLDTSEVFPFVTAAYETDKGLYTVPAQFSPIVLAGEKGTLDKVSTLEALAKASANGKTPLSKVNVDKFYNEAEEQQIPPELRAAVDFYDLTDLWNVLWIGAERSILPDNRLDKKALTQFLTNLKQISDGSKLVPDLDDYGDWTPDLPGEVDNSYINGGGLYFYATTETNYGASIVSSLPDLQWALQRKNTEIQLFPGMTEGAFKAYNVAGVNANTKKGEIATAFVQSMLSPEAQLSAPGGLPSTKNGYTAQVDRLNHEIEQGNKYLAADDKEPPFEFDLTPLVAGLTTPAGGDVTLARTVYDVADEYVKGKIKLEQAVEKLETNLKIYMAEKQR